MCPTTMSENRKPPTTSSSDTATPSNPLPPRKSRPRVREVSSKFMSPSISTPKHPSLTPSVRRSLTDVRPRYPDENRPDSVNRRSVSPVQSSKPRSAVKLFKEYSRSDTPVAMMAPTPGRGFRHPTWDTAASKLLRVSGISSVSSRNNNSDDNSEDTSSIDGDCESVRSEPCESGHSSNTTSVRVSTPCSRSVDQGTGVNVNGMYTSKGGGGTVKVARGLKLPPMPPARGCGKGQGMPAVKKAVKKVSGHAEDIHWVKLLYNHYLQWRLANAKAESCMSNQKKESERQLYSLGVKISELRNSVESKRIEYRFLQQMKSLSMILDSQLPYLDEWSTLEESYSSSLLELSNGLLNVLSQLPIVGSVNADMKEIKEAMDSALQVTEMISRQVQNFVPKAENVDNLISNLARVHSGEITLVDECGDLLSKTQLSQAVECSLRGQLMQLHQSKLDVPKDGQC